jgi:hypothetical protein
LIKSHSESPPVYFHRVAIFLPLNQFRGHVGFCTAEGIGFILFHDFGIAKVHQLDVTFFINHDILWLKISDITFLPVDNMFFVEKSQYIGNLGGDKDHLLVFYLRLILNVLKKLPSGDEFKNQVDASAVLESSFKFD